MTSPCEHPSFQLTANVTHLLDEETGAIEHRLADLRIACASCGKPFMFLGLRPGVDLQGARVSADGLEARLAVVPEGPRDVCPIASLIDVDETPDVSGL